MAWGKFKTKKSAGGIFVTLKENGSQISCVVMTDIQPHVAYLRRASNGDIEACSSTEMGADGWTSYRVQVYDTDEKCPRLLKATPGLFKQIIAYNEMRGLEGRLISIIRKGTGKDTTWLVDSDGMADTELMRIVLAEDELEQIYRDGAEPVPTDDSDVADHEAPSGQDEAAELDPDIPF